MDEIESSPAPEPASTIPHDARARRRRARRMLYPSDAEGQAAVLADLARRSYPTFELFIFAILGGVLLGAGYLLDSEAVLIFGVLVSPLLTSWVGLSIAAVTGSLRFFLQTFAALLISAIIFFLIGLAAGFADLPFEPRTLNEIYPHSRLWIPELVVLAVGASLMVITFVRTEAKPYLPGVVLAYAFYLPVSAAGFGLSAGLDGVFPQAIYVALVHFAWATFVGILTLAFMRFRPRSFAGFLLSLAVIAGILAGLLSATGLGKTAMNLTNGSNLPAAPISTESPAPVFAASLTPTARIIPTPSLTPKISAASATHTPTLEPGATEAPSDTPKPTITILPTPIFARIDSPEGGGARVRKTPNGDYLLTLSNGFIVVVLGETEEIGGVTWVKIAVDRDGTRQEGWIIQSLLATATPVPYWVATETPTSTLTPTP
jgi:hypothetical protein